MNPSPKLKSARPISGEDSVDFVLGGAFSVGKLKDHCFLYDPSQSSLKSFKTLALPQELYSLICVIQRLVRAGGKSTLTQIRAAMPETDPKPALERLLRASIIKSRPHSRGPTQPSLKVVREPANAPESSKAPFSWDSLGKHYQEPTFFDVPEQFPSMDADVHILSVPLSFSYYTKGVEVAPDLLRVATSLIHPWFEIHEKGTCSEINMNGMPRLLGEGIVPADMGSIDPRGKTLKEIHDDLRVFWRGIKESGAKPLFIGGDHAITFPIISALQDEAPEATQDLVILHFDAHHDYYTHEKVAYHHSAPIFNILETTQVAKVLSFGLRSVSDVRAVDTLERAKRTHFREGRLAQYGILNTMELLSDSEKFCALIPKGAPIYLSIDLDVLSDTIVEGAVATPVGTGLEWHHLFRAIELASGHGRIIGADVVEYNPRGANASRVQVELSTLLILLIQSLSKGFD